jgi:hypothetical protein
VRQPDLSVWEKVALLGPGAPADYFDDGGCLVVVAVAAAGIRNDNVEQRRPTVEAENGRNSRTGTRGRTISALECLKMVGNKNT